MKRIILFFSICLFSFGVNAQDGNVGVGTVSPQAKLHVEGNMRVDDNVEIMDSTDAPVFILDPNAKRFEMLDNDGNVFYRMAVENESSNLLVKGESEQRSTNPDESRIQFDLSITGVLTTTYRRPDGTIESIIKTNEFGSNETHFQADGQTPRRSVADDFFINARITTNFNENGIRTRELIKSASGFVCESFFREDGETLKSKFTIESNPSNNVVNETFDENGNLIDKTVSGEGITQLFNKNNNEVFRQDNQEKFFQQIFDAADQFENKFTAMGNTTENLNNGDKTEIHAGNIMIDKNDDQLNLNEVGFEVENVAENLQFFVDIFGISKINGSDFVGLGFNTDNEGVDIFGNLTINGLIAKLGGSFRIDHPQDPKNKFLYHSFVESPDMMNVYNGNTITDENGEAIVKLPSYFEALNMDYRYQLTVIGSFAQAIVWEKVENNQFVIKTDEPNIEVSWQVTGIRNDDFAKDNRIQVEVEKQGYDKGKLLYDPNREGPYSANLRKHWEEAKE